MKDICPGIPPIVTLAAGCDKVTTPLTMTHIPTISVVTIPIQNAIWTINGVIILRNSKKSFMGVFPFLRIGGLWIF
jgi:hypothetical protein